MEKMGIDKTIEDIHKKFGKDSIFKMGDKIEPIEVIPTGSYFLDKALGVGGIPRGRVTEIYGGESAGKTTLALHILAEAQKLGHRVAFVDAEHALDLKYASDIGVDVSELFISQPDSGEDALEICDMLARSGDFAIIVIDSVAALTPKAEIEGEMGQSHMGLQARLMSQALRKMTGVLSKSNTAIIFINQIRMRIGIVFGNPETTTGGNALKFYASVRLDIRRKEKITKGTDVVGNNVKIKVVKNKVAPPFKVADTCIMFGKGIYKPGELLQYHLEKGTIIKGGAWFKYKEDKFHGSENMLSFISENISDFDITDKEI